jgi:hypothetical protein
MTPPVYTRTLMKTWADPTHGGGAPIIVGSAHGVIRGISVFCASYVLGGALGLASDAPINAGGYPVVVFGPFPGTSLGSSVSGYWEGTQGIDPGELFYWTSTGGTWYIRLSGYQFLD